MKCRILFVAKLLMLVSGLPLCAQTSEDVYQYINTYKSIAISEMQRTGIPASIILAQGIHETEAGTSDLVKRSNNHFGIKCKNTWTGKVVYHDDDERGECFRSYDNPQDSYRDHSDFLKNSPRYQFLFRIDATDYESWAYGLKKAGYATNIRYSQILIKLIQDYNLQQYSLIALGKMKPEDEVMSGGSPVRVVPPPASDSKPAAADLSTSYPSGEFTINNTSVIFAKAGSSLLSISVQYDIPLSRLVEFNELKNDDVLAQDQLLFLKRKRKTGSTAFHTVVAGETCYYISQEEGLRLESLMEFNHLAIGQEPAAGEKLYLQSAAPVRPLLVGETGTRPSSFNNSNGNPNPGNPGSANPLISHLEQKGESPFAISKKKTAKPGKIRQWNKFNSMNLCVGQELIIYKN